MICLSFDIEEFDLPAEHGYDMPFGRQMDISRAGAGVILDILKRHGVKATFFVTVKFAENASDIMRRIVDEGHEVASHGMSHTEFNEGDVALSRQRLQVLSGQEVCGFRMARMKKVNPQLFADAGYFYESSLNPTFIPGRYNHLSEPRTAFFQSGGVLQIPASVTPWVRFPMFWLAGHVLPRNIYGALARRIERKDGYFATYFHPWEFYDLKSLAPEFRLPAMICRRSGAGMRYFLDSFIGDSLAKGCEFCKYISVYQKMVGEGKI